MKKPQGYEQTKAIEIGEFKTLEPGAYVCKIVKAEESVSRTGKQMLLVYLDIESGEDKGFFAEKYKSDTREQKKWGCIYYQLTEGNSLKFFKGMIEAIEKSNPGYTWNWDENTLKNKLVGVVFGREQYEKSDGSLAFITKPFFIRSVEAVLDGNIKPPADKLLNKSSGGFGFNDDPFEEFAASDDDIPF